MKYSALIGGPAGVGINVLARIISAALAQESFSVFNYRDYGSLIRGGHNFNIISFSGDEELTSYEDKIDFLLAFDELTYKKHEQKLSAEAIIITNNPKVFTQIKEKRKFFLETSSFKRSNMAFAAALFKILGLKKNNLLGETKKAFQGKDNQENEKIIEQFFSANYEVNFNLAGKLGKKNLFNGNEALVQAALDAGVERYFGYPMTPATGVHTLLAQEQLKNNNLFVFTPEDEIAVMNMALGASFAGKKTMLGTSGGGFDLMTEGLSLQGMTELPLVIHLAQRTGPSTGVPTYTGQADLNVALYGGHGEFPRVIMAPGDAQETYEKTIEAFYLAEKLGVAPIILTDKHILESDWSLNLKKNRLNIPERKEFPGKNIFRRNSYEHTPAWETTEDPQIVAKSVEKRKEKITLIKDELKKLVTWQKYGTGKNLLISFGSTGAILDALKFLPNFSLIHLIYLEPFPTEIVSELKKAENIFVVEGNSLGQLADLITKNTAVIVKEEQKILKYDGMPFTAQYIIEKVKERLK